jgi:ribosomal protein S18 acetylase RimI-like enzyme
VTSVTDLERIAAVGWPGTEYQRLGGWLLRAGGGFTGRANSVLPLGSPGIGLTDGIDMVRRFYGDRALPARFQVPWQAAECGRLDTVLEGLGWIAGDEAAVLVADLAGMLAHCTGRANLPPVQLADAPSPEWLAGYRYRGNDLPPSAVAVLTAGDGPVFVTLLVGAERLGVARGIVTDGWLGVTAVTVEPVHRRRGVATALMAGLGRWGIERGARDVYLQVAAENEPAFALYDRLGFAEHHRYHYRTEPSG